MCVCACVRVYMCVGGGWVRNSRETGSYENVRVEGFCHPGPVAQVPGHILEDTATSQLKSHLCKMTKDSCQALTEEVAG